MPGIFFLLNTELALLHRFAGRTFSAPEYTPLGLEDVQEVIVLWLGPRGHQRSSGKESWGGSSAPRQGESGNRGKHLECLFLAEGSHWGSAALN